MYCSVDNRDAMEHSVSGTDKKLNVLKGICPTLNLYMYVDYYALCTVTDTQSADECRIELWYEAGIQYI